MYRGGFGREIWPFLSFLSACASAQGELNHKNGGEIVVAVLVKRVRQREREGGGGLLRGLERGILNSITTLAAKLKLYSEVAQSRMP
jgi:hypothetical protein